MAVRAGRQFKAEYRCITADLRNANGGESSGPLEIDRPWDAFTDDHIGLMDHLRIGKFMVMGFCIGGPFIWNLLKRAPDRVVAAVLAQPSGSRPEARDLFYDTNVKGWAPELVKRRQDVTMETAEKFLTKMYRTNADFVFTVTRDFVRQCRTPVLILPDDIPAHPYGGGHGSGDAGAERRGEHLPVEGAERAYSAGGAADSVIPPSAPARDVMSFPIDAGVNRDFRHRNGGPLLVPGIPGGPSR